MFHLNKEEFKFPINDVVIFCGPMYSMLHLPLHNLIDNYIMIIDIQYKNEMSVADI